MKPIKVTDEVYQRLKAHATAGYRSLGAQVELVLDEFESVERLRPRTYGEYINTDRPVADHVPKGLQDSLKDTYHVTDDVFADKTEPKGMTSRELYQKAKQMEKELEESLAWNQDPDSRATQEKEERAKIQLVWDEYHIVKEYESV